MFYYVSHSSIFILFSIQAETLYSFLFAKDPSSAFHSLQQTPHPVIVLRTYFPHNYIYIKKKKSGVKAFIPYYQTVLNLL